MNIKRKHQEEITKSRDLRKLRSNPGYFQCALANIDWAQLAIMSEADEMANFYTSEIMNCLDKVAPLKNRKHKIQKHKLPNHVLEAIQRRKTLYKEYEQSIKSGSVDKNIERKYKKPIIIIQIG